MQGQVLGQRPVADNHARGVRARAPHRAFHFGGDVNQVAHLWVGVVNLFELRQGQRVCHRCVAPRNERDEFGDAVHFGDGNFHDARHVAQGGFGAHRAKGDDLRDLVIAVFAGAIFEHFGAAVVTEVKVNIGHLATARIEEALEEQFVRERVHQCDVERVGHDGTGRGAARVVPDVGRARVTAQVPDDEEVGVEAHRVDDAQLVLESFADLGAGRPLPITATQPLVAERAHVRLRGESLRDGKFRKVVALERQVHIATLGDEQGVAEGLGHLGEDATHLLRRAQVVGRVGHPHAVFVVQVRAGLDGEQDVLIFVIVRLDVVHVVGGDVFGAVARAHFDQFAIQFEDLGDVVLLQFEEETVGTEDIVIPVDAAEGFFGLFLENGNGNLGGHTTRGGDQPFGVCGQEVVVNARMVVHALQLRGGGDLEQVAVARFVFREQEQVRGLFIELCVAVFHAARRHVGFQPDDGLDPVGDGGVVEFDHPKHRAVVGDGDRGHVHLLDALRQLLDIREAVEERVVGVDVEVGEAHGLVVG